MFLMSYEIFCDGASRGQGVVPGLDGIGACAVVIYKDQKLIGQFARLLGRVSSNQAEYEAILAGALMGWCANFEDMIIYSDCALVVDQINKRRKVNSEVLKPLWFSVQEIKKVYAFQLVHVNRRFVSVADALANQVIDDYQQQMRSPYGKPLGSP